MKKTPTGEEIEAARRQRFIERENLVMQTIAQLNLALRHALNTAETVELEAEAHEVSLAAASVEAAAIALRKHEDLLRIDRPSLYR